MEYDCGKNFENIEARLSEIEAKIELINSILIKNKLVPKGINLMPEAEDNETVIGQVE